MSEWLLLVAVLAMVGVFITYAYLTEIDRTNATERDRLQVQSNVIANDIQRNLAVTSLAMEEVIHDYLGNISKIDSKDVSLRLRALVDAMPGLRALLVMDVDGVVIASHRPDLMGQNFSGRDYFKQVKQRPNKGTLYISAPFKSVRNDMVVAVTRVVPGPQGEFAGVVIATLDPEYFTSIFLPVMYAPDVWAFVVHGDGRQLVSFPLRPEGANADVNKPGTLFYRHMQSAQRESTLLGPAAPTEGSRITVLRSIQPAALSMDKALVVGLSREMDAIVLPLHNQALVYGSFYAALVLLCAGGLYLAQQRNIRLEALASERDRERLQAADQLKLALSGANLGLWTYDDVSGKRTFDDNSLGMIGFTQKDMGDDQQFWRRRIHVDDMPRYNAAREACLDGSTQFYDVTYRIQHRLGYWVWILGRGKAVDRNAAGRGIHMMGTHMDITAAKVAEQEVISARNELQAVFDNMTEGVFVFDKNQDIVRINRSARSIHGLFEAGTPMDEVRANIDVVLPSGETVPPEQWASRSGSGSFVRDAEVEIIRKNSGKSIFIEYSTAPIRNAAGDIEQVILTFRDVTERRQTHTLRESEARFRTLIEDAPLAIAIIRGGRFVYCNPRYLALHGCEPDQDLTGTPWIDLISVHNPGDLYKNEALILEDSPVEQQFEAIAGGKGGVLVPLFKTTARVVLADGPATMIFAQDISAQKQAEAALLQARDVAEAANRSKAEFLANMSHEIRSPLNAILGLAYLLEQARLNHDAHDMVRKIRASGRSLLGIINDILDVSKIEAGHMVIEHTPFRLGDVLDNLASAMGIAAGNKNIELIIQALPPGITVVKGDALRLEQVLTNLTSNAIKFTQEGRVELRIELLSLHEEKIVLRFSVIDTGIGIAPELQHDVFSPFTQADSSTTRKFGGTGLGLTICRQLVSLMGGEIGLNSVPGQGSEFWFTLPLLRVPSTEFSSPDMVRIDALIADDSQIALHAVVEIAQGLGWVVNAVDSGEAVLEQVQERMGRLPNVVVLDWQMLGMDGLATAQAIRQSVPQHECPIVIMATAYSLSSLSSQPGAEMVDAILNKPVTTSALYNAVVEAQSRRAAAVGTPRMLQQAAGKALADVRVLVVDDSEINREVAHRILRDQGATVELADDGRAALDWLMENPDGVDLVLMDVQMPVMDGIETTRRLRSLPQFNDLPIVALTAGAFKSQQEAAQAVGMTDFVSKPFDVPTTVALIQRLRRRRSSTAQAMPAVPIPPSALPPDVPAPQGSTVMDVAKGLQVWSNLGTYRSYLRRFADSYHDAVAVMNASLAVDDRTAAAALAHKIAGVAANMALPDTYRLANEAERVLSAGYDPTQALVRLEDALSLALAAIERFAPLTAEEAAAAAPRTDSVLPTEVRAEVEAHFNDLLEALDTDNPFPVEAILVKLAQHIPASELAAIRLNVRDFDFRAAETSSRKLATQHGIPLKE